eukprot:1044744-Heterocapsa_arctica.AAC.1
MPIPTFNYYYTLYYPLYNMPIPTFTLPYGRALQKRFSGVQGHRGDLSPSPLESSRNADHFITGYNTVLCDATLHYNML